MAKKKTEKKVAKKAKKEEVVMRKISDLVLPKEVLDDLKPLEEKIDKFNRQILEKFDKYILGISLLPPPKEVPPNLKPEEAEKFKRRINMLILVDDTEKSQMTKRELHQKIFQVVDKMAVEIDERIYPETMLISSLWQNCYDAKYDLLQLIAVAQHFYDRGMVAAIKISELHKRMVLEKFEKYICCYVLAGSLVQGKATAESDIDVFIVIDDTDVKKMTRAELKDKLRSIIIGMGLDAGQRLGIKTKFNIQVYILTDFWESVKEAHPVIFTFLRDGVPFYDRGVFMPWKQLLRLGRIKPSQEAIENYMKSGEQGLDRVKLRMREIGMEDFFWSTLTPSQAALMMAGFPPPTPKACAEVMRDVFVKKKKMMKDSDVDILDNIIKTRKELEHNAKHEINGKQIDDLLKNSQKYLKKIRELFVKLEEEKSKETVVQTYDSLITVMRDILIQEGTKKVPESDIVSVFEDEMISTGKIQAKFLRSINDVITAKKHYDSKTLKASEVQKSRKSSGELLRTLIEYLQRSRGRSLERCKIKVKNGNRYGEVLMLDTMAFVKLDIDDKEQKISKAAIKKDGSLGTLEDCSLDEYEKALASAKIPDRVFVREGVFESLKRIFGKDVEVLVSM
jgi:predicted nucleotidyltransferase